MTANLLPASAKTCDRLRNFRKNRRLSQAALADGLTACGFPTSRNSIAKIEARQIGAIPVDLVFAAMKFLDVTWDGFFEGPYCERCGDDPPVAMTCNVCLKSGPKGGW